VEHQRIAPAEGLVAVATLRPDGDVFVNHISRFAPDPIIITAAGPRSVFDVCGPEVKGDFPCPERQPNPLIPDVPVLPTTARAVLALKPDASSYGQDRVPVRVKMDCRLREGLRHPELSPTQVADLCQAMTGQSDFGAFLEDFVPDVVIIGGGLVVGGAVGGLVSGLVEPGQASQVIATVGPDRPSDEPLAPAPIPGVRQASEPIFPGISNRTLAVGAFAVAGVLLAIFFFA